MCINNVLTLIQMLLHLKRHQPQSWTKLSSIQESPSVHLVGGRQPEVKRQHGPWSRVLGLGRSVVVAPKVEMKIYLRHETIFEEVLQQEKRPFIAVLFQKNIKYGFNESSSPDVVQLREDFIHKFKTSRHLKVFELKRN